jgi:hypothetical protein
VSRLLSGVVPSGPCLVGRGFSRDIHRPNKRASAPEELPLRACSDLSRLPLALIQNNGPLIFFGVNDLLLLACIAYDTLVHRRLHPAYLWAGLLLIVSHPVRLALGGTSAWLAFAHWLTR